MLLWCQIQEQKFLFGIIQLFYYTCKIRIDSRNHQDKHNGIHLVRKSKTFLTGQMKQRINSFSVIICFHGFKNEVPTR